MPFAELLVGANERVHVFLRIEARHVENVRRRDLIFLCNNFLCKRAIHRRILFGTAVVVQHAYHRIGGSSVILHDLLPSKLGYSNDRSNAVIKVLEHEIKHPARGGEASRAGEAPPPVPGGMKWR